MHASLLVRHNMFDCWINVIVRYTYTCELGIMRSGVCQASVIYNINQSMLHL